MSGSVNCSDAFAGGIAGVLRSTTITGCFNSADVTATNYAGGIAGQINSTNETVLIQNCYNTGDITVSSGGVGGIAGETLQSSKIEDCYNTGKITGSNNMGGILGFISNSPQVENCYYLDGCVTPTNDKGSKLSAEDFADIDSFEGWDFTDTWEMDYILGRPVLRDVPEQTGVEVEGGEYIISCPKRIICPRARAALPIAGGGARI